MLENFLDSIPATTVYQQLVKNVLMDTHNDDIMELDVKDKLREYQSVTGNR